MKSVELNVRLLVSKDLPTSQTVVTVGESLISSFTSARIRPSDNQSVKDFHEKFGVPMHSTPTILDTETFNFRYKFMKEELDEFVASYIDGDLEGMADALIDLVYVAQGTALMMGLPWSPLWEEVQRANMNKVRATDASQSKRGSALDVIKPEGWVGPNFKGLL